MRARLPDELVEDVRSEARKEMTIDPEEVPLKHSIRALVDYHRTNEKIR